MLKYFFLVIFNFTIFISFSQEKHRPFIHFTPKANWMNDPNGMFYYGGTYHLFYQHYPEKPVWGPMHWGHATSKDLISWEHQSIAIKPDSLGTIFSGSAVVDIDNTSGFGKNGKTPIVAIFTQHNDKLLKQGRNDFQYQSLAYSLDSGYTWTKYQGNPVLANPGIADFRDPKVIWHKASKKWIMALACQDKVSFYSSTNLKKWEKLSDFGKNIGSHGGVWECPDLFPMSINGEEKWVLITSINPGAFNGGSGTQYFIGDFDGVNFIPQDKQTRWLDYGKDNYAGVTFSGLNSSRILIGWMSNWQYAEKVPTETWRSATTIPRKLELTEVSGKIFLTSKPVSEIVNYFKSETKITEGNSVDLQSPVFKLKGDFANSNDFELTLKNSLNENIRFGYESSKKQFFIDRTNAGLMDFENNFKGRHYAPRISNNPSIQFEALIDVSSIELFFDGGITTLTDIFFPSENFKSLQLISNGKSNLLKSDLTSTYNKIK